MLRYEAGNPLLLFNGQSRCYRISRLQGKTQQSRQKISYNDFLIKAVATGLEKFPIMTGQLEGDNIKLAGTIGVGLAIEVPDGLVAPVVRDADKKTLAEISQYSQKLISKAQNDELTPEDIEGGCITISNLGAFGMDSFSTDCHPGSAQFPDRQDKGRLHT